MNRPPKVFILAGILLSIAVLCPSREAGASTSLIEEDQIIAVDVTVDGKARTLYCDGTTPGTIKERGDFVFTPLKDKIAKLKARRAPQAKITAQKKLKSAGTKACKSGRDPQATPGATPQPTATATPASGNFDSSGNVTAQGKTAFGIPSNLSANISTGASLYISICAGCHNPYLGRTFTEYRSRTSASPMFFTENDLPDGSLAHITAYFNRFRP